jgi:hypothetical protein
MTVSRRVQTLAAHSMKRLFTLLFGSLATQASAIASPPGARMTTPHVVTTAGG